MKQTQFETRQRAEQMIEQANAIWQRSPFSEKLEGLSNDPVFTLLMTALAWQANELDSEIEHIRQDVIEDLSRMLIPYEMLHAMPATALIEAKLAKDIPEMEIGAHMPFTLSDTEFSFLPLFRTRVLAASIQSMVRIDGRRWKVTLAFDSPISSLEGFAFAVRDADFRDLTLSLNGKSLPLVRSSEYAQLPIDTAFGADTMLYNDLHAHIAQTTCLDLYARQNTRIFFVRPYRTEEHETQQMDLVFEFTGIADTFTFSKANLVLNSVLLVNARRHSATLSPSMPVVRIENMSPDQQHPEQFMHLICPSEEQLYGDSSIEVRYVAADRFNQASLIKLLAALNAKYHTDYQAFRALKSDTNDSLAEQLQRLIEQLEEAVQQGELNTIPGVYLLLRENHMDKQGSVNIDYLTTAGATINSALRRDSTFSGPKGLDGQMLLSIAEPVPGQDEVNEYASGKQMASYLIATGDRLVTPADIRFFCRKELHIRYGITNDMIQTIDVKTQQANDGYEIHVEINLHTNAFVQRALAEKKNFVENMLQKMIEVRSTNIYPICVTIQLQDV